MGLFLKRREVEEQRSWSWPALSSYLRNYTSYGADTSGVSTAEALRASAVWACVRVLAGSVSMLPLDVVRVSGKERLPVSAPPLISNPSAVVDRDVWLHQVVWSMMTDGNAWGLVGAVDGRGVPTAIETIDPAAVTGREFRAGVASALVDGERLDVFPNGDLWLVPGVMVPAGSPFGLSPVAHAATGVGATLSAERFGHQFFTGGGHPSTILYGEGDVSPEQAIAVKAAFQRATEGREPAVLGAGWKHEAIQVDPTDSQFIDLLRFEVENICRFFGVPPSMAYGSVSGQSVTYANVSQADLHYLKHSLEVPLNRIENALSRMLPRPQVARFNRAALLRADTMTRYQAHEVALRNKWRTVNEVRALEDEAPFPDPAYDTPGTPTADER